MYLVLEGVLKKKLVMLSLLAELRNAGHLKTVIVRKKVNMIMVCAGVNMNRVVLLRLRGVDVFVVTTVGAEVFIKIFREFYLNVLMVSKNKIFIIPLVIHFMRFENRKNVLRKKKRRHAQYIS